MKTHELKFSRGLSHRQTIRLIRSEPGVGAMEVVETIVLYARAKVAGGDVRVIEPTNQ